MLCINTRLYWTDRSCPAQLVPPAPLDPRARPARRVPLAPPALRVRPARKAPLAPPVPPALRVQRVLLVQKALRVRQDRLVW